jgi:hypothetical protein
MVHVHSVAASSHPSRRERETEGETTSHSRARRSRWASGHTYATIVMLECQPQRTTNTTAPQPATTGIRFWIRLGRHDTMHSVCVVLWKGGFALQNKAIWARCLNVGSGGIPTSACPTSSKGSQRVHQFHVGGALSAPPKFETFEVAFGSPLVVLSASTARWHFHSCFSRSTLHGVRWPPPVCLGHPSRVVVDSHCA